MTSTCSPGGLPRHRLRQALLRAPLLALLAAAGCAQMSKLKTRVGDQLSGHPTATVTPAAANGPTRTAGATSLAAIVDDDLQVGRYAEGEQALHEYLRQHPGDRAAQALLHQLTVDPAQQLGRASRPYVVQPGDSYSTLAARYLGDSSQFVLLARYNGSNNPSLLRVGQTLRLPASAAAATLPQEGASPRGASAAAGNALAATAPTDASSAAQVRRLQKESAALLAQGQKAQALARMEQALTIDPQLKPAGVGPASLRKQVIAAYHQRAIVLYRDQQLDPAIALWDRVLAIDPNYEPAIAYRARALELKQRLKQF
jgi:tetratricopeptide (TPR) repeat protein